MEKRQRRKNTRGTTPIDQQLIPATRHLPEHFRRVWADALTLLANIGVKTKNSHIIQTAKANGASLNERGRLCIATAITQSALEQCRQSPLPFGLHPLHRQYYLMGRAKYCVGQKNYHQATINTAKQAFTIADKMGLWAILGQNIIIDGVPPHEWVGHLGGLSDKPMVFHLESRQPCHEFITIIKKAPQFGAYMTNILSPLAMDSDITDNFVSLCRANIPIFSDSMPILCATTPANFYHGASQALSEAMFIRVMAHWLNPECPILTTITPSILDCKIGSLSMGAVETGLWAQLIDETARFNHFMLAVNLGGSDGKLPEFQTAMEKTQNITLLNGASLLGFMGGCLGNGQVFSPELLYMDYEIIKNNKRILYSPPQISDEISADYEFILENRTHFIGTANTRNAIYDFHYPELTDRNSINEFMRMNGETMLDFASQKIKQN